MLIIFDCDGVLVDSESLAAQVFARELARVGIGLDARECELRFRGHTMEYCRGLLDRDFPGRLPADFLATLALATRDAFHENLLPVSGVEAVLQWLQREGHAFCVASNGALSKIQHSLTVTGLMTHFATRCYSAEAVRAGKPEPDLFLHAAKSMGFEPAQTLVVEDSAAGVSAALRAGMKVCVFGAAPAADESRVYRFTHMAQLSGILPGLLQDLTR